MAITPLGSGTPNPLTQQLGSLSARIQRNADRILDPERARATDAAEIAPRARLDAHLRALNALSQGIQGGISLIQTANGVLQGVGEDVGRIQELTIRAANGTLNETDRRAIQAEIDQRLEGIDDALSHASFAGDPLFGSTRTVQVSESGQTTIAIPELSAAQLSDGTIDVTSPETASASIARATEAVGRVAETRGELGATESGLQRSLDQVSSAVQNVVSASTGGQGTDLIEAITDLKLNQVQLTVALKAIRAQLQSDEAVLELLR